MLNNTNKQIKTPHDFPKQISGPSIWTGAEMQNDQSWKIEWSENQIAELNKAAHHFLSLGKPLEQITKDDFPLPTIHTLINEILKELLDGRGFVLLRGIPVQELGIKLASVIYLGLGCHLGSLRSNNAKGHLLGHIRDQGADIANNNTRFYQTNKKLEFHTDSSDFVALLCLQKAKKGGESYLASSMSAYNEIARRRPDLLEALFMPYPTDRRGEVPAGLNPWFDMPIFSWYQGELSCVYIRPYIESAQINFPEAPRLTQKQIDVMNLLDEIIAEGKLILPMSFEPGDIQIIHNHQIFHSRSDFENWPEPERQRHLLRLWVSPLAGRPLPDYFAARWGSVNAGDRGGIIVPGTNLTVELNFN